jgi:hypothetical protein
VKNGSTRLRPWWRTGRSVACHAEEEATGSGLCAALLAATCAVVHPPGDDAKQVSVLTNLRRGASTLGNLHNPRPDREGRPPAGLARHRMFNTGPLPRPQRELAVQDPMLLPPPLARPALFDVPVRAAPIARRALALLFQRLHAAERIERLVRISGFDGRRTGTLFVAMARPPKARTEAADRLHRLEVEAQARDRALKATAPSEIAILPVPTPHRWQLSGAMRSGAAMRIT